MAELTFAGHSAILIKTETDVIAIDPWLDGNPSCPSSLKDPEQIDLIVLTHGHADHASEAANLAQKHQAKVCASFELANLLAADGVPADNLVGMNPGGCVELNGNNICFTHAIHSNTYDTSDGPKYAGACCGAIIKNPHFCVYHAGDTCLFSDMKIIGEVYQPDISLLPIGDRFTMGPQDAAVAAKWTACKKAVPVHYDTFPVLTGTAKQFQTACNELRIKSQVLKPGESIEL